MTTNSNELYEGVGVKYLDLQWLKKTGNMAIITEYVPNHLSKARRDKLASTLQEAPLVKTLRAHNIPYQLVINTKDEGPSLLIHTEEKETTTHNEYDSAKQAENEGQ